MTTYNKATAYCSLAIIALTLLATPAQAATEQSLPCSHRGIWTVAAEKRTARCLTREIGGVPGGFPRVNQIVTCESGWFRTAGYHDSVYWGLTQLLRVEMARWPTPGAPKWLAQGWYQHPSWRNGMSRLDPWRILAVTLSHVAGPEGWSYSACA